MKLKIRYEDEFQVIELGEEETNQLWVSLSFNDEELTQKRKEQLIQDIWDKQFNRPEYNNWHKFDRHRGMPKRAYRRDDEEEDETDVMDTFGDSTQESERNNRYEYDALCQLIHDSLKPSYADVLIAICLDSKTPEEYAAEIGEKRDAVYKRLQRAKKKFAKILNKCPI